MAQVVLENNQGSIRLRIQVDGKRYTITPVRKGKYDNPDDLGQARRIANLIEADIHADKFDTTLARYKPHTSVETKRLLENNKRDLELLERTERQKIKIDLKELWLKYVEFKKNSGISITTLEIDYKRRIGNTLKQLPTTNLNDSILIRDWLIKNKPIPQIKKIITQFSACCNWAIDSQLIDFNPFLGMVSKIKSSKSKKSDEDDINPFTREERDRIIETFKQNKYYSHYYYLV